ncbi:uncharacterized protein LOC125039765 [Penaeus chinensis]|uniref:uncharacterized protein LOC125039765 n=1 Tax=Penaeus chinensis TaxID=139456 RepID=UPI001FB846DA|nr:uncharacterized protein LOC125039765 [Penaeus chinensis]
MLVLWTLTLGSLLVLNGGYAVKDGCVVQDSLDFEDLAVGSVRFKAYVPPSGSIFKVKLTCDGDWHSDSFNVSSNSVTMKSFHDDNLNSTVMPAPPAEEGWTDLELKFSDTYELLDGQGQSWIGKEISPKCKLKKVKVSDGRFAKHCPEGTLKWEVEGEKCAFVPLPHSENHHTLNLTLMSKDNFKPVFHLGGVEVELGMREGSVVAAGEGNSPLKPPTQRIRLGLKRRGKNTSFTMTTGESLPSFLYQAVLASETRHVNVCEASDGKFILTATQEEKAGGATGSETAGGAGDAVRKLT